MQPSRTMLRIGEWRVDPASGEIERNGETARLDLRTMRLLQFLAEHAGETVSIDDLLSNVWPEVSVSSDSVYPAVATLRRLLGDDPKRSSYIATVPRLGYRMVAAVGTWPDPLAPGSPASASSSQADAATSPRGRPRIRPGLMWAAAAAVLLLAAASLVLHYRFAGHRQQSAIPAARPQRSVAVLPFLDLTQGMRNEEFADGMTEELIDKLSKITGLRVPSATSSFFYKNKQVALAEIAKALGVSYVLDGSVRKSGARLRVAARLVRVDNGYVMWSATYDRPIDDLLMVQEDIAGEVTGALAHSIEGQQ